ncbi:Arogenate dehydrogenase [Hartmannibacter diazotrophicus]|uniref:prephenate dehydrogenase n=1 Tax=Hartmannibacter diazotrophicus TaxID=1482074 RepID=A0A2C9DC66_9HYPH|nr:prephenate/arogenate dehydrogenase family protein [Hartmannibacter diazotrophicus]SON57897.1 Arogenate dehydrogenase [Hartmannibacter diazotrophicus]
MNGTVETKDFQPIERLAIIGIGLIGASIALGARKRGLARHIAIADRSPTNLARAEELGLGDSYHAGADAAVKDADLVICCVPVGASGDVAREIARGLMPGAIVSDVGSVKGSVVAQMAPHLPKSVHFIPGHPVAGTEFSGPDAGLPDLFVKRWCILTPPDDVDESAKERLIGFWTALGAMVECMSAEHHDLVLAITSHVPHLIAYNIVGTADDLEAVTESEVMKFSAGGFRDFTRIAASDPTMWRDVFLNNREAVIEVLGRFTEDLIALQRAIRWGEGDKLFDLFTRTRAIRRGIIDLGQETEAPDFGRGGER